MKKKIMPTLFDEAAEASVSAVKKVDQETSEGGGTKKRRRTKKQKKKKVPQRRVKSKNLTQKR